MFEAVFGTRAVVSCVVKRGAMDDRQSAFPSTGTISSQSVGAEGFREKNLNTPFLLSLLSFIGFVVDQPLHMCLP